jgi:hypothetical protein
MPAKPFPQLSAIGYAAIFSAHQPGQCFQSNSFF